VVDRARKAWHEGTPYTVKAALAVIVWGLAGMVLVMS
jgi:hypothetical protein